MPGLACLGCRAGLELPLLVLYTGGCRKLLRAVAKHLIAETVIPPQDLLNLSFPNTVNYPEEKGSPVRLPHIHVPGAAVVAKWWPLSPLSWALCPNSYKTPYFGGLGYTPGCRSLQTPHAAGRLSAHTGLQASQSPVPKDQAYGSSPSGLPVRASPPDTGRGGIMLGWCLSWWQGQVPLYVPWDTHPAGACSLLTLGWEQLPRALCNQDQGTATS